MIGVLIGTIAVTTHALAGCAVTALFCGGWTSGNSEYEQLRQHDETTFVTKAGDRRQPVCVSRGGRRHDDPAVLRPLW